MSRVYSRLTTNMRLYADFFVLQEQGKTEKRKGNSEKGKKVTREETGPAPALLEALKLFHRPHVNNG